MLPLDDIFCHCKGIVQPSEPNLLYPVYRFGTHYFAGWTEREASIPATISDFHVQQMGRHLLTVCLYSLSIAQVPFHFVASFLSLDEQVGEDL